MSLLMGTCMKTDPSTKKNDKDLPATVKRPAHQKTGAPTWQDHNTDSSRCLVQS